MTVYLDNTSRKRFKNSYLTWRSPYEPQHMFYICKERVRRTLTMLYPELRSLMQIQRSIDKKRFENSCQYYPYNKYCSKTND